MLLRVIFLKKQNKNKIKSIIDNGIGVTPSVAYIPGSPVDVTDILNAYGEYEIQRTADTENTFPEISQGLPSLKKKKNK